MAEEVSGTGYTKRDITWTTVTVDASVDDLVAAQERAEAEAILDVFRRLARALDPEPPDA